MGQPAGANTCKLLGQPRLLPAPCRCSNHVQRPCVCVQRCTPPVRSSSLAGSPACSGVVKGKSVFKGQGIAKGGEDFYLEASIDPTYLSKDDCPPPRANRRMLGV